MAYHFRGNINGSVTSLPMNLPMAISSFSLVNKSSSAATVNVYMINDVSQVSISPLNQSLSASEMYEGTREIVMLASEQILIQTTGSIDYDFTIENFKP